MEMDSVHIDETEDIVDESSEQSNSPYWLYLNGIYGEPDVVPRVGDQYQAEIPAVIPECDRFNLTSDLDPQSSSRIGLQIPVMWTKSERFIGFNEPESKKVKKNNDNNLPGVSRRLIVLALPCRRNVKHKLNRLGLDLYPFPGSLDESWEDEEQNKFLLGLYILGKNLSAVKRLVESKNMGEILGFYYGKFYRSKEYKRWADGRSLRSRRSVQGHRLLSGWRQQELLSRFSIHVSVECKRLLLEASKSFKEEKMSLEEYLFCLKDKIGANMLIEAIGIGKGKKDLTSTAMEPPKTNHAVSVNSEVPSGRACSSLSSAEIIEFLTGGFRLSKARSSDLFWEAVWPRLLASGWHSEQPKGQARNCLVFLIPDVKKFSRRKLVKGKHYFDSVSDVLSKVALEPWLLEFETEGKAENEMDPSAKRDDLEVSETKETQRQQQLQRRDTDENGDVMKFMIVDTSVSDGAENSRVCELRSLPVEIGSTSNVNECQRNTSKDSENEDDEPSALGYMNGSLARIEKQEKKKELKIKNIDRKDISSGSKRNSAIGENVSRRKKLKNKKLQLTLHSADADEMMENDKDQTGKLSSASSFEEESSNGTKEGVNHHAGDFTKENSGSRADLDLNVSQVSPICEPGLSIITDKVQDDGRRSHRDGSSVQVETSTQPPDVEASSEYQSNLRKSTRNRPLTAKALEAFAYGFLGSPKSKRKETEASQNRPRSKRSKGMAVTAEFRIGTGKDASNPDEETG